ncbi:hypothetical protein IHE49_09000 [Rhodanobacter sp. 7MK24]|uniref:hypothetical protein n=1 Tax=Rhodanobacter sp. 7MK24 TaxID=2775922 RepID=UPI00177DA918|nr:hypothetical protein [Rhodanobacter sp. 7MK24]MBD8880620.1 hypothetical protein [Rhodanobacter sp. 7MK24]
MKSFICVVGSGEHEVGVRTVSDAQLVNGALDPCRVNSNHSDMADLFLDPLRNDSIELSAIAVQRMKNNFAGRSH